MVAESSIVLVSQNSSVAWFELSIARMHSSPTVAIATPLALEIEVGNGSWETSLISPRRDLADGEVDTVRLNLLLVLEPAKTQDRHSE
jgi:hypothetical protein